MSEEAQEKTYDAVVIGERADFSVVVNEALVDQFAALSGDNNPLHMDEAYAKTTSFGKRVAHGMIVGALFSRLVGMHLPGKYVLYLSQIVRFHKPIFLGTEVIIRGTVTQKTDAAKAITIETVACDASGTVFASGEAVVKLLQ